MVVSMYSSDAVRRLVEEIGSSSTGSGSGRHKHAHTHTHQHLLDMAASAGTAPLHTFILLNRCVYTRVW